MSDSSQPPASEFVLWESHPPIGARFVLVGLLGGTVFGIGLYLIIFWNQLAGVAVLSVSVFVLMALVFWYTFSYRQVRDSRYFVTDRQATIVKEKRSRVLPLDNFERVAVFHGFIQTSVHFKAADESDLDDVSLSELEFCDLCKFSWVKADEAEKVKRLVELRIGTPKESRTFRCGGCGTVATARDELIRHIREKHHGELHFSRISSEQL